MGTKTNKVCLPRSRRIGVAKPGGHWHVFWSPWGACPTADELGRFFTDELGRFFTHAAHPDGPWYPLARVLEPLRCLPDFLHADGIFNPLNLSDCIKLWRSLQQYWPAHLSTYPGALAWFVCVFAYVPLYR